MKCPSNFVLIKEGKASICVPNPELYKRSNGVYEPSWAPVFYNPLMIENRDISIALLNALVAGGFSVKNVVDSMTSSGVRGIRIALEVNDVDCVYMCDIDEEAVKIASLNVEINGVRNKAIVERADCRELLYRLKRERARLDYVDVDPFGSPAPFMQAALECVRHGGVVGVTATDLAPLEGKYPRKLFRRYGIMGTMCGISKDIAVRNLISFMARIAAMIDRTIEPLYSYHYKHYVRVYVRVKKGKSASYEMLSRCIGTISYCNYCGYWEISREPNMKCPVCGRPTINVEGTWICEIGSANLAKMVASIVKERNHFSSKTLEIVECIASYLGVGNVLPYRISFIARLLKKNMPKIHDVVSHLRRLGYKACRVLGYHDAIATNAPMNEVIKVVSSLSSS